MQISIRQTKSINPEKIIKKCKKCSYNNLLKVKVTDSNGDYDYVCFGKGLGIVAQLDQSQNITMYLGEVTIH